MKIIISPTKTMKRKECFIKEVEAPFLDKSNHVREILETYDFNKLKTLYKSSDNIVNKTLEYYQNPQSPMPAISMYDGLVFKQLEFDLYTQECMSYIGNHVFILSALYGVLYAGSVIQEYRLDYLMNFELDLYQYWRQDLESFFKEDDFILSLASLEYSESVKHDRLIQVHFVDQEMKMKSTASKMARGSMLNYLIKHQIKTLEGVKLYREMNYKYRDDLSDDHHLYFMQEVV